MRKLNTELANNYMLNYLREKDYVDLTLDDLVVTKKYKNFNSMLCRDFYVEKIKRSFILVENLDVSNIFIIENATFELFLKILRQKTLWVFVPLITNDGLVFVFKEKTEENNITTEEEKEKLLNFILNKIFGKKYFFIKDENFLKVGFLELDLTEIVSLLEKHSIKYDKDLSEEIEKNKKGTPITPDIALIYYRFPEYYSFTQEQAINEIFSIISKKKNLSEKEFSGIKILLRKVNKHEFPGVKKIALSFKKDNPQELIDIFEHEELKIKSKSVIEELRSY